MLTKRLLAALFALSLGVAGLPAGALPQVDAGGAGGTEREAEPQGSEVIAGEPLGEEWIGPGIIETWAAVEARAAKDQQLAPSGRERGDARGEWVVPKPRATFNAHSGEHYITNKWGDTVMGIGFPTLVDVDGAWVAGQAGDGVWPTTLRVRAFREGAEVALGEPFEGLTDEPQWLALDFSSVDRIVFEAQPRVGGAAWFALDDLTFTRPSASGEPEQVVLDFDDLGWGESLTGSGYGGLEWERGSGDFDALPAPGSMIDPDEGAELGAEETPGPLGPGATPPDILFTFEGIERGTNFQQSFPPDTNGAIGPNHYVIVVNRNFGVFDKANGSLISVVGLGTFQPGTSGDPRVLYDHHAGRWIVVSTDFSSRIYLAYSLSSNPTGSWFKTNFVASAGSDSNCAPDFPTLGFDESGIYVSAQMFNNCGATVWAIDKAPLLAGTPSLGTVTAFRNLAFEAIQPCLTYGNPGVQYLISRANSSSLRLRTVSPPLASPTLSQVGFISVPSHGNPPNAPALGASTPLDTGDARLGNAVYRDGNIVTAQTIALSGRAACRWYEISTASTSVNQSGTLSDPDLSFFYPGISVNQARDIVVGFTGSSPTTSPSCYLAGRIATDPPGAMSAAELYKAGSGSNYNLLDGFGRNRWGDYSLTTVDPSDDYTFWTIQEYVKGNNDWDTWVAVVDSTSQSFPEFYCTPKLSSAFCINIIDTSDPSAQPVSGAADYAVTCFDVQGLKNGLLFAGIFGPAEAPFGGGLLCVLPPTKRGPVTNSGGSGVSSCDGTYATVVNDGLIIPFGLDAGPGVSGWYQYWYRDPQNGAGAFGTALSNGVRLDFQ